MPSILTDHSSILTIIVRERWNLLALNLLLLVSLMLVVTIPAGLIAAYKLCVRMAEDKSVTVLADFTWYFKQVSLRDNALLWGVIFSGVIPAYSGYIYFQLALHASAYSLPLVLCACVLAMWLSTLFLCLNKPPEQNHLQAIKQSLFILIGKPSLMVKITLIVSLLILLAVVMFPLSLLFIISIMPALCLLLIADTVNKANKREIEGTCHVK